MFPDGRAAKLMGDIQFPCAHCGGAVREPLTLAATRHARSPRAVLEAFRALDGAARPRSSSPPRACGFRAGKRPSPCDAPSVAVAAEHTTWVGRSLERFEDEALLRGEGRFIDDLEPVPHAWHAAIVRSQLAHARVAVDPTAALAVDGVRGVLTGEDVVRLSKPFPAGSSLPSPLRGGRGNGAVRGRAPRRRRRARPVRRQEIRNETCTT